MKRILAATDFSPLASSAVNRAARLAAALGSRLTLLHVTPSPPPFSWFQGTAAASPAAAAKTRLQREAARLRAEHDIEVEEYVAKGSAHAQIAALAASLRIDLVVIGQREGFLRKLLGHMTVQHLRRRVAAPLLAVAKSSSAAYRRILVAADLSPDSEDALRGLPQVFPQARIHVLHVCGPGFEGRLPPGPPDGVVRRMHRYHALRRAGRELWQFAYRTGLGRATLELDTGDPAAVIRRRAGELDAQLVVLVPSFSSWLGALVAGSVTDAVLRDLHCDALLVGAGHGACPLVRISWHPSASASPAPTEA